MELAREARGPLEELFSDKLSPTNKLKADALVEKWNDALHGVEQALIRAGQNVSIVMTNRGYVRSTYPLQGYGRHDQFAEAKMVRQFWDQVREYDLHAPKATDKLREELRAKNEKLERLGQA